jgi:hypothetical protein
MSYDVITLEYAYYYNTTGAFQRKKPKTPPILKPVWGFPCVFGWHGTNTNPGDEGQHRETNIAEGFLLLFRGNIFPSSLDNKI